LLPQEGSNELLKPQVLYDQIRHKTDHDGIVEKKDLDDQHEKKLSKGVFCVNVCMCTAASEHF